jgi:hypothetical protein
MKLAAICLAFSFCVLFSGQSQPEQPQWKEIAKITGREAQAAAIAVREFEKHQGSKTAKGEPVYGDLRHYHVYLARRENTLQVGFAPDLGPIDVKEGTVGGGTQYGIETYYEVSLKTLKILRQTFAR